MKQQLNKSKIWTEIKRKNSSWNKLIHSLILKQVKDSKLVDYNDLYIEVFKILTEKIDVIEKKEAEIVSWIKKIIYTKKVNLHNQAVNKLYDIKHKDIKWIIEKPKSKLFIVKSNLTEDGVETDEEVMDRLSYSENNKTTDKDYWALILPLLEKEDYHIVSLLKDGYNYNEISINLKISTKTIQRRLKNIVAFLRSKGVGKND